MPAKTTDKPYSGLTGQERRRAQNRIAQQNHRERKRLRQAAITRVAPESKPHKSRPPRARRRAEAAYRSLEKSAENYLSIADNDQDPSTIEYLEEQQPALMALTARLRSVRYNHNEQASFVDCSLDHQTQDIDQTVPMASVPDLGLSALPLVSPPLLPLPSQPSSPPRPPPPAHPPSCPLSPPQSLSQSPAQFAKPPKESVVSVYDQTWYNIFRLVSIFGLPSLTMGEGSAQYPRNVSNASNGASFWQPIHTTRIARAAQQ
ncbi:hypothetical protein EJ07DRAFT_159384 [Lizonia empirigonia]|nr:hypothetical protein EJ07DRAFT_159384 [Lizonia empirigonia]